MPAPKLSIIIPVYNVSSFLRKCLDSVINQTLKEIEIIIVNDGSTDNSAEICEFYAQKDGRIKLIHQKNQGLMQAWINGLGHVTAPLTGFVDSDDWVELNMFEVLYHNHQKTNADVVCCGHIWQNEHAPREVGPKISRIYSGIEIRELLSGKLLLNWSMENPEITNSRWDKLFQTDLLRSNIQYCNPQIRSGEDLNITFAVLFDAQRVSIIGSEYLYHYRVNLSSLTQAYSAAFFQNNILLAKTIQYIADVKNFISDDISVFNSYKYFQSVLQEFRSGASLRQLNQKFQEIHNQFLRANLPFNHYRVLQNIRFPKERIAFRLIIREKFYLLALFMSVQKILKRFI